MTGVMFNGVGGGDLDLNEMTFPGVTGGAYESTTDNILVWDPATSGYTYYYYYDEGDPDYTAWYGSEGEETKFPAGTAFWYKAKPGDGKQMIQSGAVEAVDDVKFDLTGGKLNMIINPYPVAINLNDKTTVEFTGVTGGAYESTTDNILVWDPATSGYTYYYYYDEGDPDYTAWYGSEGEETKFLAGTAFWYKAKPGDSKSITFKKTY